MFEPDKDHDLSKLPAVFAKMTALKSLTLRATAGRPLAFPVFSPAECRLLLDAAPPSLESLTLHKVEPCNTAGAPVPFELMADCLGMAANLTCTFSGGLLACVRLEDKELPLKGATQAQLGAFWARALLPSRKLGPRLPRLLLDIVLVVDGDEGGDEGEGELPVDDPDPAGTLLARCDEVRLWHLEVDAGCSVAAVQHAARLYGLPARISHARGMVPSGGVRLRQEDSPPLSTTGPEPPTAPLPPALPPLPPALPAEVVQRAVERLAAAGSSPRGLKPLLLLRGKTMQTLLTDRNRLRSWVHEVASWVKTQLENGVSAESFWLLPTAGAVVINFGRGIRAHKAAELAAGELQRQAQERAPNPAAAARPIQALPTGSFYGLSVESAIDEVLQALWDGAEEGGPGPATGNREGELARMRWLLETWEGLKGLVTCERIDL